MGLWRKEVEGEKVRTERLENWELHGGGDAERRI